MKIAQKGKMDIGLLQSWLSRIKVNGDWLQSEKDLRSKLS
jgi:hypothetical protein